MRDVLKVIRSRKSSRSETLMTLRCNNTALCFAILTGPIWGRYHANLCSFFMVNSRKIVFIVITKVLACVRQTDDVTQRCNKSWAYFNFFTRLSRVVGLQLALYYFADLAAGLLVVWEFNEGGVEGWDDGLEVSLHQRTNGTSRNSKLNVIWFLFLAG